MKKLLLVGCLLIGGALDATIWLAMDKATMGKNVIKIPYFEKPGSSTKYDFSYSNYWSDKNTDWYSAEGSMKTLYIEYSHKATNKWQTWKHTFPNPFVWTKKYKVYFKLENSGPNLTKIVVY